MSYYADSTWIIEFNDASSKEAAEAALEEHNHDIEDGWVCMIGEDGQEFMGSETGFIVTTFGKYYADEDAVLNTIAPFVKSAVVEFNTDSTNDRWRVVLVDGNPVTELSLSVWANDPESIVELVELDGAKRIYTALIAKYGAEAFKA